MDRRAFIRSGLIYSSLWSFWGRHLPELLPAVSAAPGPPRNTHKKRVLVMGIDGLDPVLLDNLIRRGKAPNFARLRTLGSGSPLQTSYPPQSPVAWSNFITGMDPGGHGIFDFVHRDPATMTPVMSMSETNPASMRMRLGKWSLPMGKPTYTNKRHGQAFWELLDEAGVPATVFRMPANFPPSETDARTFSGMGTPDLAGSTGTFSYYTTKPPDKVEPAPDKAYGTVPGGRVFQVSLNNGVFETVLVGPPNTLLEPDQTHAYDAAEPAAVEELEIPLAVHVDTEREVARLVLPDQDLVLVEGEWSDWIQVTFQAMPVLGKATGMVRFFLKEAAPEVGLYVSPIQLNPADPAMPLTTPHDWCCDLYESLGSFYTQGLPEDTKALSAGVLTPQEFLQQAGLVYRERRRALDYFLERFETGFLFFYFSSIDQQSHMLWRFLDPDHPGYDPESGLAEGLDDIYQELDEAVGAALDTLAEDDTLVVMSDHGFAPFYWGVNLNTWLLEQGYIKLLNPHEQGRYKYFMNVDWSRTRAYALGLNGVYVNLKGRERDGIVEPGAAYENLVIELEQQLLGMTDSRRAAKPVRSVAVPRRDFKGACKDSGPDLIVGYDRGYRTSWESPLGEFPAEVFVDNCEAWSADHCMDPAVVPGVVLTNRQLSLDDPSLCDLTVTVLQEFGVAALPEMVGRPCWRA